MRSKFKLLMFAVLIFSALSLPTQHARADWFGQHPDCPSGVCTALGDACRSWESGGETWTGAIRVVNASTAYLECHIRINPFLYWEDTHAICDPGEIKHFGAISGCVGSFSSRHHGPCNNCSQDGKPTDNPGAGNPISLAYGNKYEGMTDFATAGPDVLEFSRYYNSRSLLKSSLGQGWRHSYSRNLSPAGGSWTSPAWIEANRHTGQVIRFTLSGSDYLAPADLDYTLVQDGTEWELRDRSGVRDRYDADGRLLWIENINGYRRTMTYDGSGYLETVTDSHGRELNFGFFTFTYIGDTYRQNFITSMTASDGKVYKYVRNDFGDRLEKVLYPDASVEKPTITYLYHPDSFFALTGIVDENGVQYATFAYDDEYRAILSKHAGDADEVTITYDDVANTRTVTNALGKQTIYHFTNHATGLKLVEVEGVASANCVADDSTYTFDTNGYVASWTDREGNVTTYANNSRGLQTSRTEASGTAQARTITTSWHSTYPRPTQIVRPNLTIDFTYDTAGRMLTRTETDTTGHSVPYVTNGQTRVWTYAYTTEGLLETVDGPLAGTGDTTTYAYDAEGYLESVTDPLSHITEVVSVNGRGQPTSIEDENGIVTDLTYNDRGWLLSRTINPGAGEAITTFAYDKVGQITQILLPDGTTLDYTYDDAHRLTKVANALGEEIVYTLDLLGNVTQEQIKDASGTLKKTQTATFDELGRMLKSIGASSQETEFSYRKNDDLASVTDPKSHQTQYAYDALNRLITVTDPLTNDADTAYDAADNMAGVTDQRSLTTSYVHNGFGDAIRRDSPDTGITDYEYDAAGNMTKKTDARSVVTNYAYDIASRLTSKTFPASTGENVTYTYDDITGGNVGKGRLTKIEDESGSTSYVYDARGNVITETRVVGAQSYTTEYAYDLADNLIGMVYPSGRIVTYIRDDLGRISHVTTKKSVSDPEQFLAAGIDYLPFGPVKSFTFGNGQKVTLSYDQDYRITGIDTTDGSTTVQDLAYGYDLASNITGITDTLDTARTQTLAYDPLDRLTDADGVYGDIDYAYDAVSNRTSRVVTDGGTTTDTLTYDTNSNRLLTVANGGPTRTLTYTANGHTTTDSRGSGFDYLYNHADRMKEVQENSATLATYVYNDLGQRVVKALSGGTTTHYQFDQGGMLIAESTDAGVGLRDYVHLGSLPLAIVEAGTTPTTPTETHEDNDDAGASFTGAWNTLTDGTGYEGTDYRTREGGTGTETFTWTPTVPADGAYRVYAKWPDSLGLRTKANYTVYHANGSNDVTLDQRINGGQWNLLGIYNLETAQNHRVVLSDDVGTSPPLSEVVVDNDLGTVVAGTWSSIVTGGEYKPHWGGDYRRIEAGTGSNSFTWPASELPEAGRYKVYAQWPDSSGHASDAKFTIHSVSGDATVPVDQRYNGANWHLLGVYDLAPGLGALITITDAADGQVVADAIRFVRAENAALNTPASHPVISDNTDGDVTIVGTWNTHTSKAAGLYQGSNWLYSSAGSGENSVEWPLNVSMAGTYRVYTRWRQGSYATNAPYTVHHDGGTSVVSINQTTNGGYWFLLGTFELTPASVPKVVLTNDANGTVIADAVLAVNVAHEPINDIIVDNDDYGAKRRVDGSTGYWTGSSGSPYWGPNAFSARVDYRNRWHEWAPELKVEGWYRIYTRWPHYTNNPSTVPYTVYHRDGSTNLTLNQYINRGEWVPVGTYYMEPGQNHRLYMQTSGASFSKWVRADAVRFVRAESEAEADIVVDNSDAGIVRVGTWSAQTSSSGGPLWGSNMEQSVAGSGENIFKWPASAVPLQGRYHLYARWPQHSNRATNAKYTVHHEDGSSVVSINQKLNGSRWNFLGAYSLSPGVGALVELSNDADGYVVADAIRLVPEGGTAAVVADAIKIVPNTAEDALYVHADHLGSPQKMTDASAAVVWDATYLPFGEEDGVTGTATNNERFPGQYKDAETGLHYNYFRDYDPTTGRYLQSDPMGLDGGLVRSDLVGALRPVAQQEVATHRALSRIPPGVQFAELGTPTLPRGPPTGSSQITRAKTDSGQASPPDQKANAAVVGTIRDLLATPEDQIDFARTKLTIDALVDPGIDIDAQLARIDDMERRIRATLAPDATSVQKLSAVRHFIYDSGPWNDHRPFKYDLEDPLGTRLSNKLLPNYIERRLGNCITMPFLFIILADRLGLDVAAATAPLHVFVKFRDAASGATYNLETTSGALPARDAHYRENLPMTDKAIVNGVYMQPLTKTEAIAVMATLAIEHAIAQGQYETAIAVADLVLKHYPTYAYAMLKKGSAYFRLMKRDYFSRYPSADKIPPAERARFEQLSHNNRLAFRQAEELGWREAPKTPARPAGQTADKREGN